MAIDKKNDLGQKYLLYKREYCYFGTWSPQSLDNEKSDSLARGKASSFDIGGISNDMICNVFWYEMSYNPLRFGTTSPFNVFGVNDILNFDLNEIKWGNAKYKKHFDYFIKSFRNNIGTNFRDFKSTNKLPDWVFIYGQIDPGYFLLSDLRRALHVIASQNLHDFRTNKKYAEEIKKVISQRHENNQDRSTNSFNDVIKFVSQENAKKIAMQPVVPVATDTQKTNEQKIIQKPVEQAPQYIQTCFPFEQKQTNLDIIYQKIYETEIEIEIIKDQLRESAEEFESFELTESQQNLKKQLRQLISKLGGLKRAEKALLIQQKLYENTITK